MATSRPGRSPLAGGILAVAVVVLLIAVAFVAIDLRPENDASPTPLRTPSPVPTRDATPTSVAACSGPAAVVEEPSGRIWQPAVPTTTYDCIFTPTRGGSRLFNGVNATHSQGGTVLARGGSGIPVTIVAGATYRVQGGAGNGGFSLEVPAAANLCTAPAPASGAAPTAKPRQETGVGTPAAYAITVPAGRVLIYGGYRVNGDAYAYCALRGTGQAATLDILDGFYDSVSEASAPRVFCDEVANAHKNGLTVDSHPLPEWPPCT